MRPATPTRTATNPTQLNTQWPYRDWVVRAFNGNLPYDQFLTWQLAGDLLENPTRDQILATAFNRLHRMTNEGGSIAEEWLVENAADRVHTLGTAVLGLTVECARCHDHKYDPITMRDYYSLTAFFNSIDENGMYDHAAKVPSPSLLLPTDGASGGTRCGASDKVAEAEAALTQAIDEGRQRFDDVARSSRPPRRSCDKRSRMLIWWAISRSMANWTKSEMKCQTQRRTAQRHCGRTPECRWYSRQGGSF